MVQGAVLSTILSGVTSAIVAAAITAQMNQASAQSQAERVVAREFAVVDGNGIERASFAIRDQGEVSVRFTDVSGAMRLDLGAGDNPGVRMFSPAGAAGFLLVPGDDGEGAAIIMGPNNQVLLQSPRQGQGFLLMSGQGGRVALGVGSGANAEEPPSLRMSGPSGALVEMDFAERAPSIRLSLREAALWRAP
jgi:hypothetical protein